MRYIIVEIRFDVPDLKKVKSMQNDTRRCLMGLRSPKVPEKVNEAVGWPVLHPIIFSYIKNRVEKKSPTYDLARGAVVFYLYGGMDRMLDKTISELDKVLSHMKAKKTFNWRSYTIYVGEDIVERSWPEVLPVL